MHTFCYLETPKFLADLQMQADFKQTPINLAILNLLMQFLVLVFEKLVNTVVRLARVILSEFL